jgi:hypothetical protein
MAIHYLDRAKDKNKAAFTLASMLGSYISSAKLAAKISPVKHPIVIGVIAAIGAFGGEKIAANFYDCLNSNYNLQRYKSRGFDQIIAIPASALNALDAAVIKPIGTLIEPIANYFSPTTQVEDPITFFSQTQSGVAKDWSIDQVYKNNISDFTAQIDLAKSNLQHALTKANTALEKEKIQLQLDQLGLIDPRSKDFPIYLTLRRREAEKNARLFISSISSGIKDLKARKNFQITLEHAQILDVYQRPEYFDRELQKFPDDIQKIMTPRLRNIYAQLCEKIDQCNSAAHNLGLDLNKSTLPDIEKKSQQMLTLSLRELILKQA